MAKIGECIFKLGLLVIFLCLLFETHSAPTGNEDIFNSKAKPWDIKSSPARHTRKHSPLDPNEEVAGSLDTIHGVSGMSGNAASALLFGLTGVSVHDCAGSFKGVDMDKITCDEYLDHMSECDSLANMKSEIQQVRKKLRKQKKLGKPCFKK